ELQRDNFERRRRVYGDGDARTWLALGMVGHYQRQLGLFRDSLETLSEARRRLRAHCGPNPGTEHRLWFERAIRLTSRKRLRPIPGFSEESIRLSSEHIRLLGADHEATMACRVIESVDLHLDGRTEQ